MTAYEYDNIPDSFETISAMPADLFSEVQRTFKAAQDSGLLMAKEAKIAHVYDRKGYLTTDELGGPRNAAYGSKTDDIVIQLTIRIQQPHTFAPIQHLENILKERRIAEQRKQLENQIQTLKDTKDAAEKQLQKKMDDLAKLGVQV